MRLALALLVALALPTLAQAQSREERVHAVPIRAADRPMTQPEGTLRLDQSVVFRPAQFGLSGPNALYAGLTDWLEIGLSWPWTRDPTFLATARFGHSEAVDVGVRVQVTAPAVTTGDTVLVVSMPVVFRVGHVLRIATAVTGDFLLTQPMHPIVRVPMSLTFSPSQRHFVTLDGAVSLVDRRFWHGQVGLTYGHVQAATALRPIGEVRLGAIFEFPTLVFGVVVGFSFWATVNPVS